MGENSCGFSNGQSPLGGPFSRDMLYQKSKSPLFPVAVGRGGGAWLQMTSALRSIIVSQKQMIELH